MYVFNVTTSVAEPFFKDVAIWKNCLVDSFLQLYMDMLFERSSLKL